MRLAPFRVRRREQRAHGPARRVRSRVGARVLHEPESHQDAQAVRFGRDVVPEPREQQDLLRSGFADAREPPQRGLRPRGIAADDRARVAHGLRGREARAFAELAREDGLQDPERRRLLERRRLRGEEILRPGPDRSAQRFEGGEPAFVGGEVRDVFPENQFEDVGSRRRGRRRIPRARRAAQDGDDAPEARRAARDRATRAAPQTTSRSGP